MATIAKIETDLLNASRTGNVTLFNSTVASITAAQKPLISVYDRTLDNLALLGNAANAASMTRTLMKAVGSYVHPGAIQFALEEFAMKKNYAAMDAVSDYLTSGQKGMIDPSRALDNLVMNDNPTSSTDNTAITSAVRDLMSKLGAQAHPGAIQFALEEFAQGKNYTAMDAVSDYLTNGQKGMIDPSRALDNLVMNDNPTSTADNTAIASAVRDLMAKLGAYAHPGAIQFALEEFAMGKNYAAMDAVSDYITAGQKGLIDPSRALDNLVMNDNPTSASDNVVIADTVRDLMAKLGANAHPGAIQFALEEFAQGKNYIAMDAVSDYLTSGQKGLIDPSRALDNLVMNDNPTSASDNTVIANTVRDLLVKLGPNAHPGTLAFAVEEFAQGKNYDAIDAVFDSVTGAQLNLTLDAGTKQFLTQNGAQLGGSGNDTINGNGSANNIYGLAGNDTIRGGAGNDRLYGEAGTDWLYGDDGNDILFGGTGNDVLVGGAGNDILAGGRGADDLTGGAGADTFAFDRNDLGTGKDRIADFSRTAGDKIDISDVLELHDSGDVLAQFVKITYNSGVATLSIDANGSAGGANFVALTDIVGLANGTTAEQLVTGGALIV